MIAGNEAADIPTARTEIDQCLALDPPAEIRGLVEQFAASLDATTHDDPALSRLRPDIGRTLRPMSGPKPCRQREPDSGASPGGGSAAAVATTPSASGTSSTQIDALRQSGGVAQLRAPPHQGLDRARG